GRRLSPDQPLPAGHGTPVRPAADRREPRASRVRDRARRGAHRDDGDRPGGGPASRRARGGAAAAGARPGDRARARRSGGRSGGAVDVIARLCSHNPDKARELARLMPGWTIEPLGVEGFPDETGETYYENSRAKADFGRAKGDRDAWMIGEDS